MPLFGPKKKRITFPALEFNANEEMSMINNRLFFLMKKEEKIKNKNKEHNQTIEFETNLLKEQLTSIKNEIADIRKGLRQSKNNFEIAVRELNMHAKIEDLDQLKRIIQEYDPGDFISYKEFQRIAEERINSLRGIE